MTQLSKLQIRAKVLSIISAIKTSNELNEKKLNFFIEELRQIEDRHSLFDVFIKEYIKMDENEYTFSGCLLKELIDINYIQEKVFDILKSNNYSDESKYKLVQLLRIAGNDFDYNTLPQYFDNPQEVLDTDTKKLLEKAIFNPEAMLDFLDFVSAVPENDRNLLIQSLEIDYKGDSLANIIYPILYSDFDDKLKLKIIEILINSKSSLAIAPFNYLIKTSDNKEIISACSTGLKKLRFSGANENKAEDYFYNIIKNSKPAEFFTTIPDGNGNQALLISRINDKNKFSLSAVVINDILGVIDCFGFFNISQNELTKVISKFYQSEGKYKVSPQYIKTRINNSVELTIKNKRTFPYEFICWDVLTKDILPLSNSIEEIIENNIEKITTTKDKILSLLTKEYTFRWYIKPSENKVLDEIINKIYKQDNITIDYINKIVKDNINIVFEEKTINSWKERITQCIYLLYENNKKDDAKLFYTILTNNDNFQIFKFVILQRSIFNSFIAKRELSKENVLTTNIFRKKQIQKENYDTKKIDKIINLLKKNWIYE